MNKPTVVIRRLRDRFEPRRLEVITGGGRRVWSADAKAAIIEEILVPGAVVSAVARRHGVTPQQCCPEARRALEAAQDIAPMTFVPPPPIASALLSATASS